MRLALVLLLLLFTSCNRPTSNDLIALLRYAEKRPDTEVILFAAPKSAHLLSSWSEPSRLAGGKYRWTLTAQPRLSWTQNLPSVSYLHLRIAAREPVPLEVYQSGNLLGRWKIDSNTDTLSIPVPAGSREVELRLDQPQTLGVHSAVITRSKFVSEFRKPNEFPSVETFYFKGKKKTAMSYETGGSVFFYESISPETVLEFGYLFDPEEPGDSAEFSILSLPENSNESVLLKKFVTGKTIKNARIPFASMVKSDGEPVRLEFRIVRNRAFGKTKTAWIEPRLYSQLSKTAKNVSTGRTPVYPQANILFVVLDAASIDHFGCYGSHQGATPTIDKFAAENWLFTKAYTNAVYTLASSATILTGQLPSRHGIVSHRNKLPPSAITLPEKLQLHGFETAAFLANGNVSKSFGLTQGFDTVREVFREKNHIGWAQDITDTFADWLKNRKRNQKFFAYLHYREPHDPYRPPDEWVKKFTNPSYAGTVLLDIRNGKRVDSNASNLTAEDRKAIVDLYDANLAYADSHVGELFDQLKKSGDYHDTIIIVTSDHGEAFWEHGYQGHNVQLYDESARIPFVMKLPGPNANKGKVHAPIDHTDIYPTLLNLTGLSTRRLILDGKNFASHLVADSQQKNAIVVSSTRRKLNAIVSGDYKYIQSEDTGELYNLKQDPKEFNNLAAQNPVRAGYLRYILQHTLNRSSVSASKTTEPVELDDASRENLRALGYID